MARNPVIEAIHAARYDLETCARHERAECRRRLYGLLNGALNASSAVLNPERLLDALFDDYREYKRAKKRAEWPRLSQ